MVTIKKYFYSLIVVIACSFVFQACATQQLEVNPGFGKKVPSEAPTPKAPVTKPAEGPEAQKPIWKVGYKWEYEWENPETGKSGTLIRRIIKEDTSDGIPCFVVRVGKSQYFYTKDVLGLLTTRRRGKDVRKRSAPFQPLAWPLRVGRQWNNVYTREIPQEESSSNRDYRFVVTKLEEVTVPAGKFKAFKIEGYYSYTGNIAYEYWYSPEVNWIVKSIRYGSSPREERLKSYTLD